MKAQLIIAWCGGQWIYVQCELIEVPFYLSRTYWETASPCETEPEFEQTADGSVMAKCISGQGVMVHHDIGHEDVISDMSVSNIGL